jgi:nucleoprotein TPR
MKLIFLSFL